MPLPQFKLREGYDASYRSGSGYKDIALLLKELHEGVLEIGNGASVLACDEPPSLGFVLYAPIRDGFERRWVFLIKASDCKRTRDHIGACTAGTLATSKGRSGLSAMLQAGLSPDEIEKRLSDKVVQFLQTKARSFETEATEASRHGVHGRAVQLQAQADTLHRASWMIALGEHL